MGEEIFLKEKKTKPSKPKRQLTQAQLDGLKKGREKMAEKRALLKKDAKVSVDRVTTQKKERRAKKAHINLDKEREIRDKFERVKQTKIKKFTDLKYTFLDKCKTEKEFNEFNSIFDEIDDNLITNTEELHKVLMEKAMKYKIPKKVNDSHISKLREMEEQQNPNIQIEINEECDMEEID